ncbi:tRNA threonylcarbamoyladenosine biosynthesis protein TsaB [hydrothermal vent metagenome]|uniref:tRNA threonylcarbamoyladenosine biosynthesis protein TsaB n=1 Tax=hydrothermal vent metagenome TaxID=652676 RepID=A0A3B0SJF8_9ZZZZ
MNLIGTLAMQTGHDRELAGFTAQMLAEAKIKPADLTRIAVAIGPGSFTGVRIGVAFARGLALVGGTDIVGVQLLQVLARQAARDSADIGIGVKQVGRGQVAWCAVDANGVLQTAKVCQPDDFLPALFTLANGRKYAIYGDQITDDANFEMMAQVDMSEFAILAQQLEPQTNPPTPWYARPPDAKLPGGIDPWA